MKYVHVYAFFLMSFFHTSCGQNQDRNGNSYPSAPLRAGGKSFQHFTTKDGLGSNSALHIYEDKAGNIWFATGGG
jgi:Two component regulator propeller